MSYNYLYNINVSVEGVKNLCFEQIKDLSKSTKTIARIDTNNATKLTMNETKLTMKSKHNKVLKSFGNQSINNIFSDLKIDRLEIGG